jgi:hypothetical protein
VPEAELPAGVLELGDHALVDRAVPRLALDGDRQRQQLVGLLGEHVDLVRGAIAVLAHHVGLHPIPGRRERRGDPLLELGPLLQIDPSRPHRGNRWRRRRRVRGRATEVGAELLIDGTARRARQPSSPRRTTPWRAARPAPHMSCSSPRNATASTSTLTLPQR